MLQVVFVFIGLEKSHRPIADRAASSRNLPKGVAFWPTAPASPQIPLSYYSTISQSSASNASGPFPGAPRSATPWKILCPEKTQASKR